jgi:hypothetical protein
MTPRHRGARGRVNRIIFRLVLTNNLAQWATRSAITSDGAITVAITRLSAEAPLIVLVAGTTCRLLALAST